jgi:hypothetical protein
LFWLFLTLNSVQVFSIKIDCIIKLRSYFENGDIYSCRAENFEISQRNVKISSIDGKHGDGKSNADVETFIIYNLKVKFLPTGIKDFFPRLKEFLIEKSQLEEIERKSFESMSTLEAVSLADNKISSIPEDLFYDLTQLKILWIGGNLLKTFPANLLMNQKKLKEFDMQKNQIEEIPKGFFKNNLELNTICMAKNNLQMIDTADMFNMKKLKEIGFNNNKCIDEDYREVKPQNIEEIRVKCSGTKSGTVDKKVKKRKGNASMTKINFIMLIFALLITIFGHLILN